MGIGRCLLWYLSTGVGGEDPKECPGKIDETRIKRMSSFDVVTDSKIMVADPITILSGGTVHINCRPSSDKSGVFSEPTDSFGP